MNQPSPLAHLLERNRLWSQRMRSEDPDFFTRLAKQQKPEYLWIGCSDSRVPANQVVDIPPGSVFVHRNIANVIAHGDLNSLSVIQFAVDVLHVKHIMVVGHYGCGGVQATIRNQRIGVADNWLRYVKDVQEKHQKLLDCAAPERRADILSELNATEQMYNLCQTEAVLDAWETGRDLTIHGWVYSLVDGEVKLHDLIASSKKDVIPAYEHAIERITQRAKE